MTRAILDLKGIARHCYYSDMENAKDKVRNEEGKMIPRAAHGVANFIEYYLKPILFEHNLSPIDIVVVREGKNNNDRRRAIFPEYKTKPKKDDADLVMADEKLKCMNDIERLMLGLGAIIMEAPFCEADDTIAYIVERTKGEKLLFTVDFDLLQLYRDDLDIYVPTREVTGQLQIKDNFEGYSFVGDPDDLSVTKVPPSLVIVHKAIVGDTSDGFKGVPGMGEGKVMDIINKYGADTCDQLLEWGLKGDFTELEAVLAEAPCKILQKLYDGREEFRKCCYLAKLHPEWCETAFGSHLVKPKYQKRVPTRRIVEEVLERNGILFYTDDLDPVLPYQWLEDATSWPERYQQWFDAMREGPITAFDYETWDTLKHEPYQEARKGGYVDSLNSEITGASFCFGRNLQLSFYLPTNHRDTANVGIEAVQDVLQYAEDQRIQMVAHNAQFECVVSAQNFGFTFENDQLPHDTIIMASHVDENMEGGLKKLSKAMLNYDQINYSQVVEKGKDMRDVSGEEVLAYGADDSVVTAHLWVLFMFILECERTATFATEIEPFFVQALLIPFIKGVPIDYGRLAELSAEDDVLFEDSDTKLRKLLTEHCSQINEEGFKIIWPEISDYQFAMMRSKGKLSDSEIRGVLAGKKEECRQQCRYYEFKSPTISRSKTTVANAAKSLGLPTLRSIKSKWLRSWIDALRDQQGSRGVVPSEAQDEFLHLLDAAAETLEDYTKLSHVMQDAAMAAPKALFDYIESVYALDSDLWIGDELNVGSPLQMAMLFYGKMGLPILIRNENKNEEGVRSLFDLEGAPSTGEIALKTWLAEMEPDDWKSQVIECVLSLRAVRIRRSLYYKPYPLWKSPVDGHVHPGLRNCGTVTRRPSGSSPNFLQISKVKDDGKVRSAVLPLKKAIIWKKAA